jgi:hypothetical protein
VKSELPRSSLSGTSKNGMAATWTISFVFHVHKKQSSMTICYKKYLTKLSLAFIIVTYLELCYDILALLKSVTLKEDKLLGYICFRVRVWSFPLHI